MANNKTVRMIIEFDIETKNCEEYDVTPEEVLEHLEISPSDCIDGYEICPSYPFLDCSSDFVLSTDATIVSKRFTDTADKIIDLSADEIKTLKFVLDKALIDAEGLEAIGVISSNRANNIKSILNKIS